jgi:hypothetical protein
MAGPFPTLIETPIGTLQLRKGQRWLCSADTTFARLRDLHRRSLGDHSGFVFAQAAGPDPGEAAARYRRLPATVYGHVLLGETSSRGNRVSIAEARN